MSKYNLTQSQAKAVVKESHPSNPNNVSLILSSDMIGKAGWWSYFGNWDFDNLESSNSQYYVANSYVPIKNGQSGNITVLNDSGILYNAVVTRGANNNTTAQIATVWDSNKTPVDLNGTEYNPLKASDLILVEDGYLKYNDTIKGNSDGNFTLFVLGQDNHKKFIQARKSASAKHEDFKMVLSEIHVINKALGSNRSRKRKSNKSESSHAKGSREEKEKAEIIFDKFKNGKKLSTEELLLLQKYDIN